MKAEHRALWASGDYPRVATELIPQLGRTLVAAAGITAGQDVLDVAAGSGNAAIPAAERGARVIAVDLTPELLAARPLWRQADERGVDLQWVEADTEALPYPDGVLRRRAVLGRCDVRTPAPAGRRRAGPGDPVPAARTA